MPKATLPPEFEIYSRVFNTPEKVRRFAHDVLGCSKSHADKILRGDVRSDLGRVCAAITVAADFPDDPFEQPGASVERAGLLAAYAREHYVMIQERNSPYQSEQERVQASAAILLKATLAVNALQLGIADTETLNALVNLRDATEKAMARLGAVGEKQSGGGDEEATVKR